MTCRLLLLLALLASPLSGCGSPGRGGGGGDDDDSASDDDDAADDDDGGVPTFAISWFSDFGFTGDADDSVIAFGGVDTGDLASAVVTITNDGTGSLEVCAFRLARLAFDASGLSGEEPVDSDPEVSVLGTSSFDVPAGDSVERTVRFTPLYGLPLHDDLHLVVRHELNWDCGADGGDGLYVPVSGAGEGNPAPDIYADPDQVDFGTVILGEESGWVDVEIGNAGPGTLDLAEAILEDTTHFELSGSLPFDLETGETATLSVRFTPASSGAHSTAVVVSSNDPDEATFFVPLSGLADSSSGDLPSAICGNDSTAAAGDVLAFDGSASFSPSGLSLNYSWTLSRPTGSAATLTGANTAAPTTTADVTGDYEATLTVTDTDGGSASCSQTFEVDSTANLRIELTWSIADDLDLHLLEANDGSGVAGIPRTDGDCYYSNCNVSSSWSTPPDWGVQSVSADDPGLLEEDINGLGPEVIEILQPAGAPYDGEYVVMVHDYPATDEPAVNGATVVILVNGSPQTFTFDVEDEDEDYYVAKIHWPTGAITPCNGIAGCP